MRQGERTDLPSNEGKLSQEQAAGLLNVGVASVERARTVIDSGDPNLIEAVERGDVSVSGAAKQVADKQKAGLGRTYFRDLSPRTRRRRPPVDLLEQLRLEREAIKDRAAALLKEHGEIVRAIATSLLTIPPRGARRAAARRRGR
jgi:hypothetical protein